MEKNKDNLKRALDNLPSYEPDLNSWVSITEGLNAAKSADVLSESLLDLPEYTPVNDLWDKIEQELPTPKSALLVSQRRYLAAAASIALLLGAFFWLNDSYFTADVNVEYAEEIVEDTLLERPWEQEEDPFQQILAMCEMQSFACTQPVFQSLKSELDELTAARDELREAIGAYGTDADLLSELKDIEMQRTDIIKQLAKEVA